jgi:hypothetical protein
MCIYIYIIYDVGRYYMYMYDNVLPSSSTIYTMVCSNITTWHNHSEQGQQQFHHGTSVGFTIEWSFSFSTLISDATELTALPFDQDLRESTFITSTK